MRRIVRCRLDRYRRGHGAYGSSNPPHPCHPFDAFPKNTVPCFRCDLGARREPAFILVSPTRVSRRPKQRLPQIFADFRRSVPRCLRGTTARIPDAETDSARVCPPVADAAPDDLRKSVAKSVFAVCSVSVQRSREFSEHPRQLDEKLRLQRFATTIGQQSALVIHSVGEDH